MPESEGSGGEHKHRTPSLALVPPSAYPMRERSPVPCAQPSPRGDAPSPLAFAKSCKGGDVSVLDPALAWDVRFIYLFMAALRGRSSSTIGILTLGHGWWWSPGGVGTWAVKRAICAICAKRAISAQSSPWPRAAVPTRVFGPPPSTELTTITYASFIVCATRSTTTAVATRAPFQHAAMAVCSTSRHGFLRRVEARRAGA